MRTLFTLLLLLFATTLAAQTVRPKVHPDIQRRVDAIDQARLESHVRKLVSFGTRHTQSVADSEERGIGAARRWIHEELTALAKQKGSRLAVAFDEHDVPNGPRLRGGAKIVNVMATLPGTEPGRTLIISGHYDSRATKGNDATSDAPGANDDASGVAVTLEAARVLSDLEPKATIIFLLTAAEEQGLIGARQFAAAWKAAGNDVEAMITNDIVGGVIGSSGTREPFRVRLFSEGVVSGPVGANGRVRGGVAGSDNDAPSRQLARYLAARGEAYVEGFEVTLIFRQDRFLRGGDHIAFNEQGWAAVRFTEVHENYAYQHQDVRQGDDGQLFGDLPENLDYAFVRRVAQANVAGMLELSMAPAPPRSVRVLTQNLTPHTELRWDAANKGDVAGYGILFRRTHEPTWTHRLVVSANETGATLTGFSKDDWLFAVQAFDDQGRRSLPIYPIPLYR